MTDQTVLQDISNPKGEDPTRSLLNLIELGTFDLDLAAWCVSRVSRGASWITGSGPGGIGKTTTMSSLLSFAPGDLDFYLALPEQVSDVPPGRHCVISNELSDHPPPTYLWDQDLRDFFALSQDHVLVANVHADGLDELHAQIVGECQVPENQFRAIDLWIFICLEGGNPPGERRIKDNTTRRVINKIFYSDGSGPHRSVFAPGSGLTAAAPRDPEHERHCRRFLAEALDGPERSIIDVRQRFLDWGS